MTLRLGGSISTAWLSAACVLLVACGTALAQTSGKSSTSIGRKSAAKLQTVSAHTTSHKYKKTRKSASKRGQQKIDPMRAREIQEALIREHYLDGAASGTWDAKSQSAMQRYQADHGWQSKVVPDSRALIKMGLGPDHEHLLNPESAMTSQPEAPRASPLLNHSPALPAPPQN